MKEFLKDEKAIEYFVGIMQSKGKSENTIRNYLSDLRHFVKSDPHPRGDTLCRGGRKAVEKYTQQIQNSGLAKSTVNRRIQTLRTFYAIMTEEGFVEENPMNEIKSSKVAKQNDTKWLERHQVRAIFEAIDNQRQGEEKRVMQRAIFSILVNCGLRVSELCDIKMDDIDWDGEFFHIVGKGDKYRKVPFNVATKRAMMKWVKYRNMNGDYLFHTERSDRMTPRAVQHMTKRIGEQLDFSFTPHELRHTALKRIADTMGKIEIVATVAGHENVNTSKRYIEPSMKEIGEAMQKTEFDF